RGHGRLGLKLVPKDQKVAVVTGSSTGIGFETCLLFARSGIRTYATMRNLTKADLVKDIAKKEKIPLRVIQMDVDKDNSVDEAFRQICEDDDGGGRKIDILVNNAGFGLFGALEDQSIEDIKKQFETNLFGAIRTIQQVLPIMRNQRNGVIVNISSLAGYVGFPASSVYNSTKFALEGLSESLAYEIEPYGISIVLIEPGVINTNFVENIMIPDNTQSISSYLLSSSSSPPSTTTSSNSNTHSDNSKSDRKITEYTGVVEKFLSHYYPAMRNAPSPKEVAKVILESINDSIGSTRQGANNNFHRYPVGDDAKFYADVKRKMSDSELHAFVVKSIL
ncbi:MAG TPA: SDR family oxidoreductase, partial [Nitrososphaeraceae archaeon]|nr:SDR family oxidoreductase [Nitrososphaeraceae archaeon]